LGKKSCCLTTEYTVYLIPTPQERSRENVKTKTRDAPIKVRVGAVEQKGEHGVPFLVTWPTSPTLKDLGSITIEQTAETLLGEPPCTGGEYLVAFGVYQKEKGWRAQKARRFRPDDFRNPDIIQ